LKSGAVTRLVNRKESKKQSLVFFDRQHPAGHDCIQMFTWFAKPVKHGRKGTNGVEKPLRRFRSGNGIAIQDHNHAETEKKTDNTERKAFGSRDSPFW
jgi:hypothetical protein